jgi:predicted dinucleotide-binding enzyme
VISIRRRAIAQYYLITKRFLAKSLSVLIAGDDRKAKDVLAGLIGAADPRPVDVGPLRRARELEPLGCRHIAVQDSLGTAYTSAVKLIA